MTALQIIGIVILSALALIGLCVVGIFISFWDQRKENAKFMHEYRNPHEPYID